MTVSAKSTVTLELMHKMESLAFVQHGLDEWWIGGVLRWWL